MKLKTKVLSALAVLIFVVSQSVVVPSADQPIISSKDTAQVYSEVAQLSELDFSGGEIIVATIDEKNEEPERVYYDVPLSEDLQDHIFNLCDEKGIEYKVAMALIRTESRFDVTCVGDSGNSLGLMQIQPRWHYERMERLGCDDLLDPYQNVTVGLDLFSDLLEEYGEVEYALMAYNGGGAYADSMIESGLISDYAYSVISYADELV